MDSFPTTTSNIQIDIDANQDNDTIRDHAEWAIKRARDVIFKGQNELLAKATVKDDSPVIFGSKADALAVLSLLGEDKKQPDDSYRFRNTRACHSFFYTSAQISRKFIKSGKYSQRKRKHFKILSRPIVN